LAGVVKLSPDEVLKLIDFEVTPARKSCATLAWVAAQAAYQKWQAKEKTLRGDKR
jgi:NifU-like protein involved in Fe-S cluster formation